MGTGTRVWINRGLRAIAIVGAFCYGYFVISWPTGFELSRATLQVKLFVLGVVAAVLLRSFWSIIFVPAAVIIAVVLAGITHGTIGSFRQFVAGAYDIEVWMFPALALSSFLTTLAPYVARGVIHLLRLLGDDSTSEEQPSEGGS